MTRIAYITGVYPRATDTFIQREIAALRAVGIDVETMSVRRPDSSHIVGAEQKSESQRTHYLLPPSWWGVLISHLFYLTRAPWGYLRTLRLALSVRPPGIASLFYHLFYFAEAGLVARQMKRCGAVHLHNHGADASCTVAMLAAELGGFSFSFTIHGPGIFFEPERWRIGVKASRALFVSCISHFCRSQVMLFAPVESWPRLHIVHCGVEPARYRLVEHRGQGRRLLFVGRLASVKGIRVLFEAVARLRRSRPEVQLDVVGDGPERQELESTAKELGIAEETTFHGYRSQSEVRDFLASTDVFVLPSFAEGVPVVLMEALASGVPVIATRVGGNAELVEDEVNGFLVAPGDVDALVRQMDKLLSDTDLRQSFGEVGRARVEREFDTAREGQRLAELFESYLSGRAADDDAVEHLGEPPRSS